ncbi:MAG: beta-propeller domain-containing protein [Clostridia bacterium]|nr:beta-propeller domain-containing protein [Clostridia bacterium]
MKNFEKELENKLMNEEITLPESLSAENIEKLINEKGGIVSPKRIVAFPGKKIAQWVSAAAIFVILIGVTAVIGLDMIPVQKETQNLNDTEQQEIIENHAASSDYSVLHKTVLNYYKDIYNNTYYAQSDSDGIFNGFFDNFGAKNEAAMDMAVNNSVSMGTSSSAPTDSPSAEGSVSEEAEHSTTNTQVQGVDEADIVKTDGKYIYYYADNTIKIVETDADAKMKKVSEIELEGYVDFTANPSEMFLYNDTLVVILKETSEYQPVTYNNSFGAVGDCCCIALKTDTIVKCFDISDKTEPKESFTHKITGDYVSSRITDGKLIAVARFSIPYNSVQADDFEGACEVVKDVCVPEYSFANGEMKKIPAERIKVFDEKNPETFIVTSVVNLDSEKSEPKVNALLGGAEEIYCTKEEIFVAETLYSTWTQSGEEVVSDTLGNKNEMATRIHKMEITDDGVNYSASVTVCGNFINQFSMDKHGDYFRIATNGMNWKNKKTETMVYVVDKDMKIVGFLGGIAPEEQMKSARFMGEALYLVTFMQTDPLFIVDLSDPVNPEIKGELKIPGFSTYLHPAGEGLLIGVGEGGTMTGTDGTAKISLFDVSDPYNPKELDNYSTGTMATFTGNHKEFVTVDENTFAVILYYDYSFGKAVVFSITDGGIVIDDIYNGKSGATYGKTRAVFIGENVYVVNNSGIMSYKTGEEMFVDMIDFW